MKNTKLEFIRFDSADVIATSGLLSGLWCSGHTWIRLTAITDGATFKNTPTEGSGFVANKNYGINTSASFDENKYYLLDSNYAISEKTVTVSMTEGTYTGAEGQLLIDYQEIKRFDALSQVLYWLDANGTLIQ